MNIGPLGKGITVVSLGWEDLLPLWVGVHAQRRNYFCRAWTPLNPISQRIRRWKKHGKRSTFHLLFQMWGYISGEEACICYRVMQGNGEVSPGLSVWLAPLWQKSLGKNSDSLFFKSLKSGENFTWWEVFLDGVSTAFIGAGRGKNLT